MAAGRIISGSTICVVILFTLFACAKPKPEPVIPPLPAVTKNVPPARVVKDAYAYALESALFVETEQFLAAESTVAPPLPEKAINFDLQQLRAASGHAQKDESVNSKNNGLTLFFDVNTSALDESEALKLRRFIQNLSSAAEVEINGYTCRLGPDAYNQKLAGDRAAAVARIFNKHGVRVRSATGMPGRSFISDTNPAINRRAEIRVYSRVGTASDLKGGD